MKRSGFGGRWLTGTDEGTATYWAASCAAADQGLRLADNLAVLRDILQAFNEGRLDDLRLLCSPDIKYVIRGQGRRAGEYHGPDAFVDALGKVKELTEGTMTVEPVLLLADADSVMMYAHVAGRRTDGRTYDNFQAYVYRFRHELLFEGQTIPVDQEAFDAFTA